MENIKDTVAGLENLRNRLNAVDEKGSVETERILKSLKSRLVEVESREIAENDSKLRRLAADLVSLSLCPNFVQILSSISLCGVLRTTLTMCFLGNR